MMKKICGQKTVWIRVLLGGLVGVICFFPLQSARANSLPPPAVVWLVFEYATSPTPRLSGVQLLGCETSACEQPVLLHQYGICNQTGCVASPELLTDFEDDFECSGDFCRASTTWGYSWPGFRVVAQFTDRVRVSEVAEGLPADYGEERTWRVLVNQADLSLQSEATPPEIDDPFQAVYKNLGWAGISIAVELLAAGLCFQLFARTDLHQLPKRLLMVLLVNLINLPVAWLFIPALGRFQEETSLSFGYLILFTAGAFTALLAFIYRTEGKTRRWLVILTAIMLVLIAFCYLAVLPALPIGYGSAVHVWGLSTSGVIITVEVFAIVFEALMITLLSRRTLSPGLIWLVSFIMNAASFLIGIASRSML